LDHLGLASDGCGTLFLVLVLLLQLLAQVFPDNKNKEYFECTENFDHHNGHGLKMNDMRITGPVCGIWGMHERICTQNPY